MLNKSNSGENAVFSSLMEEINFIKICASRNQSLQIFYEENFFVLAHMF